MTLRNIKTIVIFLPANLIQCWTVLTAVLRVATQISTCKPSLFIPVCLVVTINLMVYFQKAASKLAFYSSRKKLEFLMRDFTF